jgi:hypothetical protein
VRGNVLFVRNKIIKIIEKEEVLEYLTLIENKILNILENYK